MIRLLLCFALSGCSLTALVRAQAAEDFACPEKQVQTVETLGGYVARGCGREALYNHAARSPLDRAAFDLSCPPAQLKMVALGDAAIGVEGCGKKASYAWVDGYAWVGGSVR